MTLVSVIAPVYNEAAVIEESVSRLTAALVRLEARYAFEIILVNDRSRDDSLGRLKRCLEREPRLRVTDLCRNYGSASGSTAARATPSTSPSPDGSDR